MNKYIDFLSSLNDPYNNLMPENKKYCNKKSIDILHCWTCEKLGVPFLFPKIVWKFEKKFRSTLGEAEYFIDTQNRARWRIRYALKPWMDISEEARCNTIVHEVCHLAVEVIHGHGYKSDEEYVFDHGTHWQELMYKCGEDPFLDFPTKW